MRTADLIAPSPPARRAPRNRRVAALLGAAVLVLAACSTGGDEAADPDGTTTTEAAGASTTEAGDTTSTTGAEPEPDDGPTDDGRPTDDELEALLPSASDIGDGYREVPSDDDDDDAPDEFDQALEDACPGAAEMMGDDDGDPADKVERTFEADDGRTVAVGFDRTPRNLDEDSLEEVIELVAGCGTINAEVDGFDMAIDLSVERDDAYGDRGAVMTAALTMDHPQLPAPIDMTMRARVFLVGPISVMVEVMDGVDDATFETIPGDTALLDTLPGDLEAGLADLLG